MSLFSSAQINTSLKINPVSPIKYRQDNGSYSILSYIKGECLQQNNLKGYVDNKETEIVLTEKPDSILVWLPMIGEQSLVEIKQGKKTLVKQSHKPFIPSEWGYFKNGTIHIIQSSHQDIAWMDTPEYCREDRINQIILPALNMMKENPEFKFEMEQTLNLMEFLDEYPDRKDELIKLYKEKRFSWGATFNQPYEGLSSGEQLVHLSDYSFY